MSTSASLPKVTRLKLTCRRLVDALDFCIGMTKLKAGLGSGASGALALWSPTTQRRGVTDNLSLVTKQEAGSPR
jgi:hypothetical protein